MTIKYMRTILTWKIRYKNPFDKVPVCLFDVPADTNSGGELQESSNVCKRQEINEELALGIVMRQRVWYGGGEGKKKVKSDKKSW